jgi:hypothetical protein
LWGVIGSVLGIDGLLLIVMQFMWFLVLSWVLSWEVVFKILSILIGVGLIG